jgi:hypothetical protein
MPESVRVRETDPTCGAADVAPPRTTPETGAE